MEAPADQAIGYVKQLNSVFLNFPPLVFRVMQEDAGE